MVKEIRKVLIYDGADKPFFDRSRHQFRTHGFILVGEATDHVREFSGQEIQRLITQQFKYHFAGIVVPDVVASHISLVRAFALVGIENGQTVFHLVHFYSP